MPKMLYGMMSQYFHFAAVSSAHDSFQKEKLLNTKVLVSGMSLVRRLCNSLESADLTVGDC